MMKLFACKSGKRIINNVTLFNMKKIILICFIALLALNVNAQTGPGGVGNSDGTSGQPKNVLWLDANTLGYADGDDLDIWTDLSGNNNDLTQATTTLTPFFMDNVTDNLNGHPIARFSKADNRIIINPFSDMPTSGITTFIIYKTSDSGDGLVSYNTASRDNAFLLYNNSSLTTYLNGGNNNSSYAFNSGSWQIMSHKWKSSGGDLIINHNGDQIHTTAFQNGISIPTGGCLAIGGEQDAVDGGYTPGQAFQGDIAEIIMYNSFLNSAQRIIVENYLSEKYNLTFTTGTNDKYTGNDAAYVYNIAGIGQEADGDHTQTTSGGLYIYEWNSSLANGEYLMLGHDNTTNNSTTIYTGGDLPTGTEASWARQWYVEKTSTDGIDAKLIFDFKEGLTDGQYPANVANYVLLYRAATTGNYSKVTVAGQGTVDADQVYFNISDANLSDGYYTIASDDTINSPVEGVAGRTWYALASGDWDTWDFWTLDPSGALPNNPDHETPDVIDKVVIHTGKTITISANTKTVASITVDGILQLGTTSGHNFTEIRGAGRIRLASDNFPLGDATHFTSAGEGEGTVVWQGGSYNLSTAHTFYKMEVDLDNAANILTLLADYTINGDMVIETGILQINDNASTTNLNIEVQGNITVEVNGQILTGTGNARHQFDMYGDFTNNGTVKFTNRVAPNYTAEATDGIVDANFLSDNSNQTILCNGITNFYRIEIDKGADMTYELAIEASVVANFKLYGYANEAHGDVAQLASNANALALIKGTVRIKSNVEIPHLNRNGNYNISEAARLWVDGGTVSSSVSNSIVPYGVAQISAGTFEALVPQGFTLRENGSVVVEGGTLNANQIRTSVLGPSHVGSYIQTGGTANLLGTNTNTDYYVFNLTFPENVFQMTGGTLHIHEAHGKGGIFINSDPSNVNVTGGTVICEIDDSEDFIITSRASFWNVIMRNTTATNDHVLDAGVNVGATDVNLAAQPLVVLNDLTLEGANSLEFITNNTDVLIGRNFIIEDGATYTHGTNTTKFVGSTDSDIEIGATTGSLGFYNLEIEKDQNPTSGSYYDVEILECTGRTTDPANADNTIIQISNNLTINRGQFTVQRYTVSLLGDLSITDGKMIYNGALPGRITLEGPAAQSITGSAIYNPVFGNIELDNANGGTVNSDIELENFILTTGILDLGTNRLTIDTNFVENGNAVAFSATKMIQTSAAHGARGLKLKMDDDYTGGATVNFPVGSNGYWTEVDVNINTSVGSVTGYLNITPVNLYHPTRPSGGCDAIEGYWKTTSSGLSSTASGVEYQFYSSYPDPPGGGDFEYFLIGGTWTRDDGATTPGWITFEDADLDGFPDEADFTIGKNACFNNVDYVYSVATGDWDAGAIWNIGAEPETYDYVYIKDGHTVSVTANGQDAGKLIVYSGGTLDISTFTGLTYNIVKGGGEIRISSNTIPSADYEDFVFNDTAIFEYYGGTYIIPTDLTAYPNLEITGTGAKTLPNQDIIVKQNLTIDNETLILNDGDDLFVTDTVFIDNAGILQYPTNADPCDITVFKSIDLSGNSAANTIQVESGGSNTGNHNLYVWEDIILNANAVIDLYDAADNAVDLYFNGDGNSQVNDAGGASIDLNRLIIDKSVNTSDVDFLEAFTLNGPTNGLSTEKALYLISGDLTIDDAGTDINLTTGDDDFEIPGTASLEVKQGVVNVSGDDSGISLDGKLLISGGTVDMDDAVNNGNNYIEYSASGNAELVISAGSLTVGSQIRRGLGSSAGILTYTQSGGTVIIGKNAAPEGNRGVFEILNTGSSFTHSAGNLYIVRKQINPTFATLYLDPETSSLTAGTTITLGNASTPASQEFGIYSTINLQNLSLDNTSTNNPKAKMWTVPLSMDGELTIQNGTEFKANGLDLNLYGDFTNNGTFSANQNTTYFKGTADQAIDGNTTFYNLTNQNTANLNLVAANTDITIENILTNESGSTINDNSNDIFVYGDIDMSGVHVYGGAGDGITLNGTSQQIMTGDGTFGKLTINNANGIDVPVGNELTINDYLKLESGIFDIGGNLLTLNINCVIQEANPFGANNMIQTNISFTDNGIKKIFPSGALNFIYPLGSGGKYTPVEIITTVNTATGAYIIAKGADELHPSIQEDAEAPDPEITDADNVLQYYWVLTANGFTDMDATVEMYYDTSDVEVTAPYDVYDYITAKLLSDGTGNWYKYDDVSKFDEPNQKLIFDISNADDIDIAGDYTAGVDGSSFNGAIPDQVPLYTSNGSGTTMDWHTAATWVHDAGLPDIPRGARVRILAGDIVQTLVNYISAYTSEINGTLDVGTTFGNRVGVVSGTGTLYTERGSLPAGYYETFFSASGGTIEFGGSTDYSVLSNITQVNNIKFSETGDRELPNLDLTVLGDFTIDGDDATLKVINEFDKKTEVRGNLVFNAGTFDAGTGAGAIVEFNGTSAAQTISGTGSFTAGNAFNHVIMNNTNGLTLSSPVEIDGNLTFTSGIITTSSANILTVDNSAETTAVTGYSSSNYVDGPMRKLINSNDDFVFPVGDASRYGRVEVINTATTGVQYWEAQYYNLNPHSFPMDTSSREAGLEMVSGNEYWRIENVNPDSSRVKIRWDDQSLLPAMTSDRAANMKMVEWSGALWEIVDGTVTDGGVNSGTILSDWRVNLDEHYFTLGTTESAPLPTATFTNNDTSICAGQSVTLSIDLTGDPNWNVTIEEGGDSHTFAPQATSPLTFSVDSAGTYTITAVSDNNGAGVPFGPDVTVTVVPVPTAYNVTGGGSYCAGDGGMSVGLSYSDVGVNYELFAGVTSVGIWAGIDAVLDFGNQTNTGTVTYSVVATDASGTCSENMASTVDVTENPLPTATITVSAALDTICDGSNTQIDIDFTTASISWDLVIDDGTNPTETINGVGDPYAYIPVVAPIWVDDGTPDTDYVYTIQITDSNTCVNTLSSPTVTVFKVPDTGPQYHIEDGWSN